MKIYFKHVLTIGIYIDTQSDLSLFLNKSSSLMAQILGFFFDKNGNNILLVFYYFGNAFCYY